MRTPISKRRSGITLMEVLVSLFIFLLALGALVHMYNLATDRAVIGQLKEEGVFLCQSKIAEFAAGVELLESKSDAIFDHDDTWTWSCTCEQLQTDIPKLWSIEVTVRRERQLSQPIIVTLRQLIIDPEDRGSTMDPTPERAEELEEDDPTAEEGTGGTTTTNGANTGGN